MKPGFVMIASMDEAIFRDEELRQCLNLPDKSVSKTTGFRIGGGNYILYLIAGLIVRIVE